MVKTDNLGLNLYEQGDTFRILGTGGLNESLQTIDEKVSETAKAIEEITQSNGKAVTGTLSAGKTSITLTDDSINENSTIEPYTSVYGVNPKTITVSNGSVTLTFKSQTVDIGVKVVVK